MVTSDTKPKAEPKPSDTETGVKHSHRDTVEYLATTFMKMTADTDDPLRLLLEQQGFFDGEVHDFALLPPDRIRTIECNTDASRRSPLSERTAHAWINFGKFAAHMIKKTGFMPQTEDENDWWMSRSKSEFMAFRVSQLEGTPTAPPPVPDTSTPARMNGRPPMSLAQEFDRSIKRDKTHYKEFKQEQQWDKWSRGFRIQARSHGLHHVLDPSYTPNTTEETELFAAHKRFMMTVFEHTLQTDMGKSILYKHEKSGDAQALYKELEEYMVKSTSSDINADDILTHLCSTTYDPKTWTGGAKAFVIHWDNQARIYNDLVSPDEAMQGPMKTRLLQKAVKDIPELRTIETTAKQVQTGSGTSTGGGYSTYLALLQGAAHTYDTTHIGRRHKPFSRHANLHEFDEFHDASEDVNDLATPSKYGFDIDTDIREINLARSRSSGIHKLKRRETYQQDRKGRPYLPGDLFKSLTSDQRNMWETWKQRLKEEADGAKPTVPHDKRTINAHEFSDEGTTHNTTEAVDAADEDNKIMSYLAGTREELSSSDIRSVLSTSRQVRNHEVIYRVTQSNRRTRTKRASIVDRGATGGCGTADLRLLEETLSPKVTIIGVDDNELNNIPICNYAGYTETNQGP